MNQSAIIGKIHPCQMRRRKKLNLKSINFTGNLANIQVSGIEDPLEGKRLIVNLFFWLNKLEVNDLSTMKESMPNEWPILENLIEIKQFF